MQKTLVKHIACIFQAYLNCTNDGATRSQKVDWQIEHRSNLDFLVKAFMPSGSGIDCGTKFDLDASTPEKLVFLTSFHHMNNSGYYDGWTEHKVIVTPSLVFGYDLKITGRDRNGIKEYLAEVYSHALDTVLEQTTDGFTPVKNEG